MEGTAISIASTFLKSAPGDTDTAYRDRARVPVRRPRAGPSASGAGQLPAEIGEPSVGRIVGVRRGLADTRRDEAPQAVRDVDAPGVAAHVEALVRRREPDVGEADLSAAAGRRRQVEPDLGPLPFRLVVDEAH